MQAIIETLFDVVYLFSVIAIGILIGAAKEIANSVCLDGWL